MADELLYIVLNAACSHRNANTASAAITNPIEVKLAPEPLLLLKLVDVVFDEA